MRITFSRQLVAIAMAAVTVTASSGSWAQPNATSDVDRQVAQSLFEEGRALLEAKRFGEACPKFAESLRLDPGGGTMLNLALCLELEGRTATAWARYQDGIALAVRDGRKEREEFGRARLANLTPKLTRILVSVSVPAGVAESERVVQLDGSRLAREAWGTAIAVDPGRHRVTSTVGRSSWETTIDASEPGKIYRVEVGEGETVPEPIAREVAPIAGGASTSSGSTRSTAFWWMLGGGAATVVASFVVGGFALGANADAASGCIEARSFCSLGGREASERARTLAWLSTGLMAGGILVGAGAFLLPRESRAGVTATAQATGEGASVQLRAAF